MTATLVQMKDSALKQQPYNKPLIIYAVQVDELKESDRYKYVLAACDNTACIKVFLNEKPELNSSYLCYRYNAKVTKTKNVYLTVDKRMPKTEADAPHESLITECRQILNIESPTRSIMQAKSLTSLSTVVGIIVEDYESKNITVNGKDKVIKKLKIKDSSDDAVISIWQPENYELSHISVGKTLQIKNVSPRKFGGNIELNSTRNTVINLVETPITDTYGIVVAYTTSSLVIDQGDNNLLEIDGDKDNMPEEECIKKWIRQKTDLKIEHIGNKLVKLQEVEFPDESSLASWMPILTS